MSVCFVKCDFWSFPAVFCQSSIFSKEGTKMTIFSDVRRNESELLNILTYHDIVGGKGVIESC